MHTNAGKYTRTQVHSSHISNTSDVILTQKQL